MGATPGLGVGQVATLSRSQQFVQPHGATRLLPLLAEHKATSQSSTGNVPEILLLSPIHLRPEGRSRGAPGVVDAGGTRSHFSAVSSPISVGIEPVILLWPRNLRGRGAVARRVGRRGRGGNSQQVQRRELADLGRDRAGDLVGREVPATPRGGRAARRASADARGTRRSVSFVSWPLSVGIGPSM